MIPSDRIEARARAKIAEVTGLAHNSQARRRIEDRARKSHRSVPEMLIDIAIGARLRRARTQAGMGIERFAALVGVGLLHIAAYEAGRAPVGTARLITIARLTDRDPEWFIRPDLGDGLDAAFTPSRGSRTANAGGADG